MDQGVKESDILLAELEKQLKGEYSRAASETREKLKDYLEKYEAKNKIKLQQLAKKEITKAEYTYWRTGQIMIGNRWAEMADTLAQDFTNVDKIARSAVHGHMADVYALNHNYAAFEIEKQSLVDTSYSLYNRQTVEKLWRENPQLLPDPAEGSPTEKMLRENADLRWNRDHIQSELVQGILQGESVQQMAKRMENVAGMDSRAAIRNARTMNTMALNAGRLDQMRAAAALGLHVTKEWRATLDDRTRASHIDLDGEEQEIEDAFTNGLMYPGDPDGDGSEVYNCRCYLRQHSDKAKASDLGLRNLDHMSQTTYDEWKESKMSEEKKQKRREAIAAARKPKELTFAEKISAVKDRIAAAGGAITEDDLKEAGSIMRQEYEQAVKDWEEKYAAEEIELIEKTSLALDKKEAAWKRYRAATDDEWQKAREEYRQAQREYNVLINRLDAIREGLKNETSVGWTVAKLSEVRSMGIDDLKLIKKQFNNSRSEVYKHLEYAYSRYPTDWINHSLYPRGRSSIGSIEGLYVRKTGRGYYDGYSINLSGYSINSFRETAFHELGHRFEEVVPGIKQAEKAFYDRRTAGEPLEWLGKGYRPDEVSRKDDFIDKYMGKDYGGSAYELVSMGFEYAYCDPGRLAKDKDMQEWIYGLLCLK